MQGQGNCFQSIAKLLYTTTCDLVIRVTLNPVTGINDTKDQQREHQQMDDYRLCSWLVVKTNCQVSRGELPRPQARECNIYGNGCCEP